MLFPNVSAFRHTSCSSKRHHKFPSDQNIPLANSRILITGIGGPAGRAAVRFFREQSCEVIGTDIVRVDDDTEAFHLVPRGDDFTFSGKLLRLIQQFRPALLVPTVSEELPTIARLRDTIRTLGTAIWISEPQATNTAHDKLLTANQLQALGCSVPLTLTGPNPVNAREVAVILRYPFIAKPRIGRGGRGVCVYATPGEALKETRDDIIYQEFVPGKEFNVNLFAYPAGRTRAAVVLLKTGLREGLTGNAVGVQRVERSDIAAIAIDAVKKLQLEGPLNMDIRLDSAVRPMILEINARLGADVLSAREVLEELYSLTKEWGKHQAPLRNRPGGHGTGIGDSA